MSIIDSLSVSVSGMTAQRQRVNSISENLANANTTRTPQGGPYRRREVIFAAVANDRKFEDELRAQERSLDTATQVKVVGEKRKFRQVEVVSGEHAGTKGYVFFSALRPIGSVDIYRARQPAGSGNPKAATGRHAGPSEVRPGSKVRRTTTPSTVCLPVR